MAKEKICGIYCIENITNNRKYIGQSVDVERRFREHRNALKKGKHINKFLQRDWVKCTEDSYKIYIIEECLSDVLNELEIYYIYFYKTCNNKFGYNMTAGGGGCVGLKCTDVTRKKISEAQIGRKLTDEWKNNISKAHKGKMPKNINILIKAGKEKSEVVLQYDIDGNFIMSHISLNECARYHKSYATNVVKAVNGKQKTFKGFILIRRSDFSNDLLNQKLSKITKNMRIRFFRHDKVN